MRAGTAEVRGATLAYEISGSGPDVVWGHGLSSDRVSDAAMGLVDFDRIAARVVRYDARGHGQSDSTNGPDDYTWNALALDQLALVDALGISTYVAAGASMGTGTALHAALLAPHRVRALVLAIPPTAWESRRAQTSQWALGAAAVEAEGVDAFIAARAAIDLPRPVREIPGWRDELDARLRRWDPRRLATVLRGAARADLPAPEDVRRIGVPTLVLAWTGDPVHPLSTAHELARLLPQADLVVADRREELATWTDEVNAFLERVGDARSAWTNEAPPDDEGPAVART